MAISKTETPVRATSSSTMILKYPLTTFAASLATSKLTDSANLNLNSSLSAVPVN